jgi:hypothetical protein
MRRVIVQRGAHTESRIGLMLKVFLLGPPLSTIIGLIVDWPTSFQFALKKFSLGSASG